jgi:hypothetical protein
MLPVESPFKIYTGTDGKPLDGGYVYFGQANQNPITSPVTVYWDAAGTQPAAQPLRTVNGYIVRAGTPANVFFNSSYSELVQDSKGRQVFYARTSNDFSIATAVSTFISQLASSTGASLIGMPSGGTLDEALLHVTPMMFGAVGDGVADDTTAVHAAFVVAHHAQVPCRLDGKTYRVTSSFTANENYADLLIDGGSTTNELSGQKSRIILDSASPSVFFYEVANRHHLQIKNCTLQCAQYALDRPFIKFTAPLYHFTFENVDFESVEQPLVFSSGSYFQSSSLRNVQFRNSGTLHSKSAALVGTLLVLDNVNHEGSVPVNSEKIVCNLKGIRDIWAPNFLLEGALPGAGWQILNFSLGVSTSPSIFTDYAGRFENYHSEWSGGNQPTIEIGLNGMLATFSRPVFSVGSIQLNNNSFLTIEGWRRTDDNSQIDSSFTFLDSYSRVVVDKSHIRNPAMSHALAAQLVVRNCSQTFSGAANDAPKAYMFSTLQRETLWEWGGGLVRPTSRYSAAVDSAFGALRSIETNATYGRLIRINRNGQNYPIPFFRIPVTPEMIGKPVSMALLANFPAANGGTFLAMFAGWDGGAFGGTANLGNIVTGSYVWQQFTVTVPAGATYVEFNVGTNSGVVASDILIAAQRFVCGADTTPFPLPAYPLQVVSFATAAPTTGTWAVGDRVANSAPAVGSPKGWACTVAGTPGTWVSEGNL